MDERVVIRIEVNADTSAIDRVQAKLAALSSQAKIADKELGGASDKLTDLSGASTDASKSTDKFGKSLRSAGNDNDRFSKRLNKTSRMFEAHRKILSGVTSMLSKGLKFALLGTVIEFAAMAAALSTVNGLLGAGRLAMKGFNWMMSGTAYLAAAATAALATVAAAQREYNAAMVQFQYKSAPGLGNGTAQAMSAMRTLTSDTKLASFGMEALNQTFASISKSTEVTAPIKDALRGLGDFAVAAGGDIGKNLAAAGEFLGLLQKEGKITAEVAQAAGAVGPQFQKAVENAQKMGLTGASELMKAFSSGTFAETAGIAGSLDAVNDTLIGRAKAFFTSAVTMFADLGQAFLPDVKYAFEALTRIFRVTFTRIGIDLQSFGVGNMLEDIVKVTEKAADLFADMFGKYLPQSEGMMDGLRTAFNEVRNFFGGFRKSLLELSDAARVVTDTFGQPIMALINGLGEGFQYTADLALQDQDQWREWGATLENVVDSILNLFQQFKNFISANLPLINGLFNALATVIDLVAKGLQGLAAFTRGNAALGGLLSLVAVIGTGAGLSAINERLGRTGKDRFGGKVGRGLSTVGDFARKGVGQNQGQGTTTPSGLDRLGTGAGLAAMNNLATKAKNGGAAAEAVQQMTVSAATVYVNGPIADGAAGKAAGIPANMPAGAIPHKSNALHGPFQDELLTTGNVGRKGIGGMLDRVKGGLKNPAIGRYGPGFAAMAGQAMLATSGNEAAAPFQAVGGLVSLYNPLAGLGISAAGTALTAETAGGGAISGAAAGAAIGTMIAPGVGTAVGAAIGTIAGGVSGYLNSGKAEKERIAKEERNRFYDTANLGEMIGTRGGKATLETMKNRIQQQQDYLQVAKRLTEVTREGISQSLTLTDEEEAYITAQTGMHDTFLGIVTNRAYDLDRDAQALSEFRIAQMRGTNVMGPKGPLDPNLEGFLKEYAGIPASEWITRAEARVEAAANEDEALTRAANNYEKNMNFLIAATGKGSGEIEKLAQEVGVNLLDSAMNATEMMSRFGVEMSRSVEQFASSVRDSMLKGLSDILDPEIERLQGQIEINQLTQEVRQRGGFGGGAEGDERALQYLQSAAEATFLSADKNPFLAAQKLQTVYGAGGTAYLPGQQLAGVDMGPLFGETLNEVTNRMVQDGIETLANNIIGGVSEENAGFIPDKTALKESLRSMYATGGIPALQRAYEQQNRFIENPELFEQYINDARRTGQFEGQDPLAVQSGLRNFLASFGIAGFPKLENVPAEETQEPLSEEAQARFDQIVASFDETIQTKPQWWEDAPAWWTGGARITVDDNVLSVIGSGGGTDPTGGGTGSTGGGGSPPPTGLQGQKSPDTTTSRLARTMGRHSFYNSMLPGKRMVTSSLRNTNLGSLKSDHLTGNAYDLTGQNLVGYANMVNQSGGFAEFHGSGFDRHLHVVPGAVPVGDTMTPAAVMVGGGGAGNSTAYNITINAAQGQDPNAIAAAVMAKIDDRDRNMRERS